MKKYLITSREFYTDTPAVFRNILRERFVAHSPDFALYRDKSNPRYKTQASDFVEVCAQFENIKSFIHTDADLAKSLGARGVHLTSTQFDKIEYAKSLNLEVAVSAHTHEEVLIAEEKGADYATYSPIFASPNKGEPKGMEDLRELLAKTDMKIFALGGIVSDEQVDLVEKSGVYGFASIRYFY
jgi:thiamine-phosphate pyrophosphorylase